MSEILLAILGTLSGAMFGSLLGFFFAILLEKRSRKINAEEELRYLIKEYSEILSDVNKFRSKIESICLERKIRYEIRNIQKICGVKGDLLVQINKMLSDGMNKTYHGTCNPEPHEQLRTIFLEWNFYDSYPGVLKFMEKEETSCKKPKKSNPNIKL